MNRPIPALAITLLASHSAVAGELYRCSAKDVVRVEDDGTVGRYPNNFWRDHWAGFLVDTDSGTIRRQAAEIEKWTVIQKGGTANDFVASRLPGLVSASTDLIRVRAWAEKPAITFIVFSLSMMVTGVCEAVQ
ncbi:hypothetical protein [Methylobacterium sp. WL7]|uniref:hypothetical protein n=1 Tax=Methylobacterium sp. WL7 TaxID=2603900 RepID=UPI0011CAB17A|nr:hypothetical protein [Methylobacterium sp. WL7]TXN46304.1 hypothetical protein FV233_08220 [Methylobacterium sp. WL7]